MKTKFLLPFCLVFVQFVYGQELKIDFPYIKTIDYQSAISVDFARYGFCQFRYNLIDTINGLKKIQDSNRIKEIINTSIDNAIKYNVNVLVFPELVLAISEKERNELLLRMQMISKQFGIIFIAGSFYNKNRENTVPIVLPTGVDFSYKIKQSKFEVSPICDEGMVRGDTLVVISSKYGKILPIVCVDLISDEIQFIARYLSNKDKISILLNLTYNPASIEFMREMSSIVKRHQLFGGIINVANPDKLAKDNCGENSYGNTSLFASLDIQQEKTLNLISDCFKDCEKKNLQPAYSTLISQINSDKEGIIIMDLNLSTVRPPKTTNAPDQGYPTLKELKIIEFK
jgi:predicted amidohydrolase